MEGQKTLFILRHAKSSWTNPHLTDHDRPLNRRGLRDAPIMGKFLATQKAQPDLILTSSAVRALETARMIAGELNFDPDKISIVEDIYEAHHNQLLEIVQSIKPEITSAMIIGHNPGFTALANLIASEAIEKIPTCGVCTIELEVDSWSAAAKGKGKLLSFDFPKKFRKAESAESSASTCS